MKNVKLSAMFTAALLVCITLTGKVNVNEVKADAAIKDGQAVAVKFASYTTDKEIKAPVKPAESTGTASKGNASLNRGGSVRGLTSNPNTVSPVSNSVVSYAYQFNGFPYVWGATGPRAFDCSGFTMYVYGKFGVSLPHYTGSQFGMGQAVSKGNLKAGDLVFFNTYGSISHVGIYIGGGDFIHAANSRTGVTVSNLSSGYYAGCYAGARRVLR